MYIIKCSEPVIYKVIFVILIGYCTEYNMNGAVIQDRYGADFTMFKPPCPSSYNTAKAYKCQFISGLKYSGWKEE